MNDWIEDFLIYIGSEKGLSPHTISAYQNDLEDFSSFVKRKPVSEVTQDHIIQYLSLLRSQDKSSATVCRHFISLKVFFRFLKRERGVEKNVTQLLSSPKIWQLIPNILTIKEVDELLKTPNSKTSMGVRDRAILHVMYASGLRASELCHLSLYDVDDEFIRVKGKGGKDRVVPIGKEAIYWIDQYLLQVRDSQAKPSEKILFLSRTGQPLDRVMLWRTIKKYVHAAGITKNISPHSLRHSFATHLLDNGADLRIIQEMLGHADISSTERYTHISTQKMQSAFHTCHPRK